MNILGVSAFYHDSSAALLTEEGLIAAAQEERFTRKKADARFPAEAMKYCLREGRLNPDEIGALVFYEKPWLTFERLLESYVATAPHGLLSYLNAMPLWLSSKFNTRKTLKKQFRQTFPDARVPPIYFSQHHLSHAASAFYPSPFENAVILCADGVGEWATTSAWLGSGRELKPLWEIPFPHSVGLLYSAFTGFCGFKVNSGEYKLMGLAPFGRPRFVQVIEDNLIDIKADGTFRLNMDYFSFVTSLEMTNEKFAALFGVPARAFEGPMDPVYMDLAASIQHVTNTIMLRLARTLRAETGQRNLCLAGGVALNCVTNGLILKEKIFDQMWVQPAAGDAGGSLGAALAFKHLHLQEPRLVREPDQQKGSLLGPSFSEREIQDALARRDITARVCDSPVEKAADLLAEGKIVAWFNGRMEFGPRALGSRSILGDARDPRMKSVMNQKIKFREGFRPFAPIVLKERASDHFELEGESPYMLMTATTRDAEKLPAITHVDGSARVQTVDRERNAHLHDLLLAFEKRTSVPVLINTSFNVRGEPIVHTPLEAIDCFINTDIDALVLESIVLERQDIAHLKRNQTWSENFERD